MKIEKTIYLFLLAFASCVPAKQFQDIKKQKELCETERSRMKAQLDDCETNRTELQSQNATLKSSNESLKDQANNATSQRIKLQTDYDELNKSFTAMKAIQDQMLSGKDAETRKAMAQFQKAQGDLILREDSLRKMEKVLNDRETKLNQTSAELKQLQDMLAKKDAAVRDLKKKVSDALVGFNGNGLTIEQKNGKVYVSLEEQLLFASGSTVVDQKGKEALKNLAKVLEQNKDINILIEGNTDNVPIAGGPVKDNWDLSVQRATSVVRIILESAKIDPLRITPAGKGEYNPVASNANAESRKKNRRIEIILTPKLDELLKMLETN